MAKIASIEVVTWGRHGFVVTGEFENTEVISSRIFTDYGDALKEMQRLLLRETFRYENNIGKRIDRQLDWNSLPLDKDQRDV